MQSQQLYRLTTQAQFPGERQPGQSYIPNKAVLDTRLKGVAFNLLSIICMLDESGGTEITLEMIQAAYHARGARLQRGLSILVETGYIKEVAR